MLGISTNRITKNNAKKKRKLDVTLLTVYHYYCQANLFN